ncbi:MAG TPA: DUF4097 family beta strand repeat-containing protein [Steroidobacteraceae bacterium]|nr:DUF4097 family beta strand repeat-containing protein [Steroidobacteraceae bacterium]
MNSPDVSGRKARLYTALLLLAATTAFAGETVDERQPATARGTVEVSNVAGTITVRGTSREEVHVTGELGSKARLEFSVEGARTIVKVVLPKSSNSGSTDLDVEVPNGSDLTVSGVSIDIDVTDVHGRLDLQTISGEVQAEGFDRDVRINTVSGDINLRGNKGSAVANIASTSGNIEIKNMGGDANATSVSGDLNLRLTSVGRSRLRTTSGTITLYGELTKDARVDSETVSGDINFYLGGSRDGDYEIATAVGEISNCFGPEPTSHRYGPGEELKFSQGSTSASLRAKTLSGDISLCKE